MGSVCVGGGVGVLWVHASIQKLIAEEDKLSQTKADEGLYLKADMLTSSGAAPRKCPQKPENRPHLVRIN